MCLKPVTYLNLIILPDILKIDEQIVYKRLNKYFTDNPMLHQLIWPSPMRLPLV